MTDTTSRAAAVLLDTHADLATSADDLLTRCVLDVDTITTDPVRQHQIIGAVQAITAGWDDLTATAGRTLAADELASMTSQRPIPLTGHRERPTVAAIPSWVRVAAWTAEAAWRTGTAKVCMHDPSPTRGAETVLAAFWRPDVVVCTRRDCQHLLGKHRSRSCDNCPGELAGGAWVSLGRLCLLIGLCGPCNAALGPMGCDR